MCDPFMWVLINRLYTGLHFRTFVQFFNAENLDDASDRVEEYIAFVFDDKGDQLRCGHSVLQDIFSTAQDKTFFHLDPNTLISFISVFH